MITHDGIAKEEEIVPEEELSVAEPSHDLEWSIYPNPVNQQQILHISLQNLNQVALSVCNINGQVVHKEIVSSHMTKLPMSHFSAGMYVVEIRSGSEIIGRKKLLVR